jgi:hypothetical protein
MNSSIELAEKETGIVLAKDMLSLVKGKSHIYMHGEAVLDRPSWSDAFIFRLTIENNSNNTVESRLRVPGYVSNGNTSAKEETGEFGNKYMRYTETYRPMKGFWSLSYSRLSDILEVLPREARVSFYVYLDAGTNEYLIRATGCMNYDNYSGLHGDTLYLLATYKKYNKTKTLEFIVDKSVCAHNSARFGAPKHERDKGF